MGEQISPHELPRFWLHDRKCPGVNCYSFPFEPKLEFQIDGTSFNKNHTSFMKYLSGLVHKN